MQEDKPVSKTIISIITPSFNRAGMIVSAIESVLAQDFLAFEHIIIDGGSTDNTPRILHQYPHLKVIREPDQGMYDALNKGLALATGEIIGFLNTDDLYGENIFSKIAENFDDPAVMAVTGRAIVFSDVSDGEIKIVNTYDPKERSLIENLTGAGAFFNAWFYRRSTFMEVGTFNPVYKIAGDRDFMFRFALNKLKYVAIDDLVYKYRVHRDSLTFDKSHEKRVRSADEHLAILNLFLAGSNFPPSTRGLLIHSQTLETVDMAARSIWSRNFRGFVHYSLMGSRHNPFWLLKLLQYVLGRGAARVLTR